MYTESSVSWKSATIVSVNLQHGNSVVQFNGYDDLVTLPHDRIKLETRFCNKCWLAQQRPSFSGYQWRSHNRNCAACIDAKMAAKASNKRQKVVRRCEADNEVVVDAAKGLDTEQETQNMAVDQLPASHDPLGCRKPGSKCDRQQFESESETPAVELAWPAALPIVTPVRFEPTRPLQK